MTPIHAIHVPNAPRVDLPSAFTVVAPDQFTARNNATVLLLRNELYKKNADIIGFAAKRIGIYNKENNNEST